MTAIFAFVGNLFGGYRGIYQVHNNGNLYDFGFLIGIGAFAGGPPLLLSAARNREKTLLSVTFREVQEAP